MYLNKSNNKNTSRKPQDKESSFWWVLLQQVHNGFMNFHLNVEIQINVSEQTSF